jgi:hypothetical protein
MTFKEKLKGYPLYRYVPKSDWAKIDNNGLQPNLKGKLHLTPHFFRFSEEARWLLGLPGKNLAEFAVSVDPDYWMSIGLSSIYQPLAPIYGVAGFGYEVILTQPIPRNAVIESFELENSSSRQEDDWDFRFTSRL